MRRLPREFYQGHAFVHWSMTIDNRRTGWLSDRAHRDFRELSLHTLHRYRLLCPVYCLMPDHTHMLWMGIAHGSDQHLGVKFFRQRWSDLLRAQGVTLQKQAWDVVLREKDRERNAFESEVFYITENPVREGLADVASQWIFSGSLAIGFPAFDWRQDDFRQRLWTIYEKEVSSCRETERPM